MKNKREYDNQWYAKNKERIGKKKVLQSKNLRRRNMDFVIDYLNKNPCIDCGECDFRVLEFDHKLPADKVGNICDMSRKGYSIEKIKIEIEKCCVRCANCHRRKTSIDFNWYVGVNLTGNSSD